MDSVSLDSRSRSATFATIFTGAAPVMLLAALMAPSLPAQCSTQWLPGQGVPGVVGDVFAVTQWDPDGAGPAPRVVVCGGNFSFAGSIVVNNIAMYDPASGNWSPLGTGIDGGVVALTTLPNGDLVAGGIFTTAGGVAANNIARWDGTAWSPLGTGMSGPGIFVARVNVLTALANGDLIAGGEFAMAGGLAVNSIARWNGTAWSSLGTGLTIPGVFVGEVNALTTLPNGDLVAGGYFTSAGGVVANSIARWNGSVWSPLGLGTNGSVRALATLLNGDVVAGVTGTLVGGALSVGLARWDGAAWSPMGSGVDNYVSALTTLPNGDLLVGGYFATAGGVAANNIARWDGAAWSPLGAGTDNEVRSLAALPNGDLIAGGGFRSAGGVGANHLARWNGTAWAALGTGINDVMVVLAPLPNGDLLAGGVFTWLGGVAANRIARWNGAVWSPLGAGIDGHVLAVTTLPNGDIIAGGYFTSAGGVAANHIARWDGTSWSPLGTGMSGGSPTVVTTLKTLPNGDVIAGGWFSTAGGVAADSIARWDGTSWSPLGAGVFGIVFSLAPLPNGELLAGGTFTAAGGVAANRVARWDGTSWSPLGTGVNGTGFVAVHVLSTLANGDVIAAGNFTTAGGIVANHIARWDGTAWSPLGAGVSGTSPVVLVVETLPNGDLLVGGEFTTAGAVPANRIARWNGASWSAAGGAGLNGVVRTVTTWSNGDLVVGGDFTMADGRASAFFARVTTTCPATVATQGAGCSGSGGPNVLTASALPWIGSTFRARATGMPASSIVLGVWGLTSLAIPLTAILPQSVPGCTLLVSADVLEVHFPVAGMVAPSLAIPNTVTLVGAVVREQVVPVDLDAVGNVTAVTSSNALVLTIGSL